MENSVLPPQPKVRLNVVKCSTPSLGKSQLRDCDKKAQFKGRPISSATFCPKLTLPCPISRASQSNLFPWIRGLQAALPWVAENSLPQMRSFPRPHVQINLKVIIVSFYLKIVQDLISHQNGS